MKRSPLKRTSFRKGKPRVRGAIRCTFNGRSFPSQLERDRYAQLLILERAGELSELKCQPQTHLTRARVGYKPDFSYMEKGKLIYEETKGFSTAIWQMKKKLWRFYGPSELRILKRDPRGRIHTTEIIHPKGCEPDK